MDGKTSEWRPGPSVCRCCLAEGCYKDISTEYFWMGKREVYAEMLSDTFSVSIAYSSAGGPNSHSRLICEPCISRLRDAADFKRQVQECERTFMQHLDPGNSSAANDLDIQLEPAEKEVKLEQVKLEKQFSDDDFNNVDFVDDDDDDMDDQPLTKFATKVPKKETADFMDLIDNSQITVKRMPISKRKQPPAKKVKVAKNETIKATASKAPIKVVKEKKKKEQNLMSVARMNARLIIKYSTAYPFKLPESKMVCVCCDESFAEPAEFRMHMCIRHKDSKGVLGRIPNGYVKVDCTDLRCRKCTHIFQELRDVATHLHTVHGKLINVEFPLGLIPFKLQKGQLACALCSVKFFSLRTLSRHTLSHFRNSTCETCGKSYANERSLQYHVQQTHNGKKSCSKCKAEFDTSQAKWNHLKESPKCWYHICGLCNERFLTWNKKQTHVNLVHLAIKQSYVCHECGENFVSRSTYRTHFTINHTAQYFACSFCDAKYETKLRLDEHMVSHTKEKSFPCTVCSKMFPRKKNLVQHMWVHSEYKRFECKLCNKKFNQRVSWKTHMRSYHPELVDFV